MIDPLSAAIGATISGSPAAAGLMFLAGALTSAGPCVAPRYVAVAALAQRSDRPGLALAAYLAGLIGVYTALGFAAGSVGRLWLFSGALYGVLGVSLIAGGCWMLVRAEPAGAHDPDCPNRSADRPAPPRSLGGIALLGAAGALIVSPCCTPVLAAAGSVSTTVGNPLTGAALLACFAAGHAVPLLLAGSSGAALARRVPPRLGQAPAIVGAVLTIALGAYYGVLA